MNWKNILFIGMVLALFLGMVQVSNASDVENHGMVYDTIYGSAHLKSGSLESEVFTTYDNQYESELLTLEVTLDNNQTWEIKCKVRDGFEPEIVSVKKIMDVVDDEEYGQRYKTIFGSMYLKNGSIESGEYEVWNASDYEYTSTGVITLDGVKYDVTFSLVSSTEARIVGVEKHLEPEATILCATDHGRFTPMIDMPNNEHANCYQEEDVPFLPHSPISEYVFEPMMKVVHHVATGQTIENVNDIVGAGEEILQHCVEKHQTVVDIIRTSGKLAKDVFEKFIYYLAE